MKLFNVPITHEYIQELTDFDLNFIEWASALDDKKLRDKLQNMFDDPEYDEWVESVESGEDEDLSIYDDMPAGGDMSGSRD